MSESKLCARCEEEKPITEFNKSSVNKSGLVSNCKSCQKILRHEYYLENKTKELATNKKYKQTYLASPQSKEKTKIRMRNWTRQWRKKPHNQIASNLRIRLNNVLKSVAKASTTKDLTGCSFEELTKYLESQFQSGMTWENYGIKGWHIDHVRPCASFDLTNPQEQKACFHYANLQPLWARDNLIKGNKVN